MSQPSPVLDPPARPVSTIQTLTTTEIVDGVVTSNTLAYWWLRGLLSIVVLAALFLLCFAFVTAALGNGTTQQWMAQFFTWVRGVIGQVVTGGTIGGLAWMLKPPTFLTTQPSRKDNQP